MKVQVKVLTNSDEINEAKSKNEFYAKQRKHNETLVKSKRAIVPDDLPIPEPIIELSDLLIDVEDVKSARVYENGMIGIHHLYRGEFQIVYSEDIWRQLEQRFNIN